LRDKYNPDYSYRRSVRLKNHDYLQAGMYFVTLCCQDRMCRFGKIIDGEMILNDVGGMIEKWCVKIPDKFSDIIMDEYVIMPNHFHAVIVNTGVGRVNINGHTNTDGRAIDVDGQMVGVDMRAIGGDGQTVGGDGQTHGSAPTNESQTRTSNEQNAASASVPASASVSVGADPCVCPQISTVCSQTPIARPQISTVCPQTPIACPRISTARSQISPVCPQTPTAHPQTPTVCPQNKNCARPSIENVTTNGERTMGEHMGSPLHTVVQWFKTMTTNEYLRGIKTFGWGCFNKRLWQRNYYEHIIRNGKSYQKIVEYITNNPANWENDDLFYR
jgi:REP element-mobilizing transposase RayT